MDERELRKLSAAVDYAERQADVADHEVEVLTAKRDQALADVAAYEAAIAEAQTAAAEARERVAGATADRDDAVDAIEAMNAPSEPPQQASGTGSAEDATIVTVDNAPMDLPTSLPATDETAPAAEQATDVSAEQTIDPAPLPTVEAASGSIRSTPTETTGPAPADGAPTEGTETTATTTTDTGDTTGTQGS